MGPEQTWQALDDHRTAVADLLETLTPTEWATPSWCTRWTVRDVAAHLSLAALTPVHAVVGYLVRSRGSFDRMIDQASRDRARARSDDEIVADLRSIVGSRRLAPGTLRRDPLLDVLVHSQDLARPIGRDLPLPLEPARVAADWAWQRRFPFFPATRLRGVRLVATDVDWTRGAGEEVRGPVGDLLLLSCGRRQVLPGLSGPGVAVLAHPVAA